MKSSRLTAPQLRVILAVSLFVIVAITITLALSAYTELKKVAVDVGHTTADANASQNNIQTLQEIQQKLEADKDVIERTNSIVAESQSYQYQDQILADLQAYASNAGIAITNIDFAPPTTTQTAPAAGTPTTPAPSGVKSTSVSVTLKNPIDYNNLLRFLSSIEQNLTKMQISKVSLSKDTSGSNVVSDVLTIEVYVR